MFKLSHLVTLSAALSILNGSAYAETIDECIGRKSDGIAADATAEDKLAMSQTFLQECCAEGDDSENLLCNIDETLDEFAQGIEEGLAELGEGIGETLEGLGGALEGLASVADCMDDAGLKEGCDCNEIVEVLGGDGGMAASMGEEMVGVMKDCCSSETTTAKQFNECFAEKLSEEGDATPTTLPEEGDATPTTLPEEGDATPTTLPEEGDATPTTLPAEEDATPTTLPADAEADTADEVAAASDSAGTGAFVSALTSVGIMSVAAFTL